MKARQISVILIPFALFHYFFVVEAFQPSSPSQIHPAVSCLKSSNIHDEEYEKNSDNLVTYNKRRRSMLVSSFGFATCFLLQQRQQQYYVAHAKYGESTNIEMPNYIEYLIEKNSSLDEEKVLYKGADPTVLLQRLQEANKRLGDIPNLAEDKKWSQIQGIITGPLGTLGQTINQIVATTTAPDSSSSSSKVKDASKKVKSDVIAIGQAASKKDATKCSEMAQLASRDLESFVKIAFE